MHFPTFKKSESYHEYYVHTGNMNIHMSKVTTQRCWCKCVAAFVSVICVTPTHGNVVGICHEVALPVVRTSTARVGRIRALDATVYLERLAIKVRSAIQALCSTRLTCVACAHVPNASVRAARSMADKNAN